MASSTLKIDVDVGTNVQQALGAFAQEVFKQTGARIEHVHVDWTRIVNGDSFVNSVQVMSSCDMKADGGADA